MAGQSLIELPPAAIRLIGSGQVITSVYSVVKELVENSFDAGCTSLEIKLDGYGLEKIEISDSGCGIKNIDVPFVAKRHYTSKLVACDDLQSLETYGFRGEALASLCAVSDVTIATKTADEDVSYIYDIDFEGSIKGKKPSHLGTGTTVTARNLFFNLPVRKQFYTTSQRKKDDLKRIEDLLIIFGIIRPQMRITLRHDREIVWQKMQASDTKGALQSILSRQVFSQLLYTDKLLDEVQGSVCAYLPKPGSDLRLMSRSTGDRTFIVVNERPVHIKELVRVLKQYYTHCHGCDATRFPICYVYVKLPASDVDVNVDPNKTTVLLKHLSEVRTCLEELLLKVYGPLEYVPKWHYSDAAKITDEHKNGESSRTGGSKTHTERKSSGKPVHEDAMRDHEIWNTDKENPSNNREQETVSDIHKPLPNVSLTFHSSKNTSSICSGVNADSEHRKTPNECSGLPEMTCHKFIQNASANDYLSQRAPGIENSDEHLNSCAISGNLTNEELLEETLKSLISSESAQQISIGDKLLDITEQSSNMVNSIVRITPQSKQQSLDADYSLEADLVEDGAECIQISTESGRSPMNGNSWSMGHGIMNASGKQLQPVKLLTLSSKQTPGKRPLTSACGLSSGCPRKQRKMSADILLPGQSTLTNVMRDQSVRTAAFEEFCLEKRSVMLDRYPCENEEAVNEMLEEVCENLNSDDMVKNREKCVQDTSRQDKKVIPKKADINSKTSHSWQSNDQERKKRLKRRLYHSEKKLECDVKDLRAAVLKKDAEPSRIFYETPTVIGQAISCDAWLCGQADKLCVVNVYRLGEAVLYRNLRDKHKLLAKPWQSPINVRSVLVTKNLFQTLEQLAQDSQTKDIYFHINDERLVANGFDVLCHRDSEEKLQAELVGLCDLVPAYNISDLSEVLEMISRNPNVTLGDARPIKVLYYLQGEVCRILQSLCKKSVADIQEMVNQLTDVSDSTFCIHQRPVFHDLFDLKEVKVNTPQGSNDLELD